MFKLCTIILSINEYSEYLIVFTVHQYHSIIAIHDCHITWIMGTKWQGDVSLCQRVDGNIQVVIISLHT